MKWFSKNNNAAKIGLFGNILYVIYVFYSYLYFFDFFSYYSLDLAVEELLSISLIYLDVIMLCIYLLFTILESKYREIIKYLLLVSLVISCIKLGATGLFPYTDSIYLELLVYISYIGLFVYMLNIFDIVKIKFANNKFFLICIILNILPWLIYLFIAPETSVYTSFYLIAKISIIPFFYKSNINF